MSEATITSKGRVTIPVDIRNGLSLAAGDRVVFTCLLDGTVVMRPRNRDLLTLKGILRDENPHDAPVPVERMSIGRD